MLNPEYGGDGKTVGRCTQFTSPVAAFPAHWAPVDVKFYTGSQFPRKYQNGAFIAFHGSWNRAPEPQAGYNVTFQGFANGKATGDFEVFAQGFAGKEPLKVPERRRGQARRRRAGARRLAVHLRQPAREDLAGLLHGRPLGARHFSRRSGGSRSPLAELSIRISSRFRRVSSRLASPSHNRHARRYDGVSAEK